MAWPHNEEIGLVAHWRGEGAIGRKNNGIDEDERIDAELCGCAYGNWREQHRRCVIGQHVGGDGDGEKEG